MLSSGTAAALDFARQVMFTPGNGDRPGVPNYALVLTDGYSNVDRMATPAAATNLKLTGCTTFTVGIGNDGCIDPAEIAGISSDPDVVYSFLLDDNSLVDTIVTNILDVLCQA